MNRGQEFNESAETNKKEKLKYLWYDHKKSIIIAGIILVLGIIVLIVTLISGNGSQKLDSYKAIEGVMVINAKKYAENNEVDKNEYISLKEKESFYIRANTIKLLGSRNDVDNPAA